MDSAQAGDKLCEKPNKKAEKNVKKNQLKTEFENAEHSISIQKPVPVKKMKVVDYLKTSLFPPISSMSSQEIIKIGKTFFKVNGRLLIPIKDMLHGKRMRRMRSYKWNTDATYLQNLPERNMAPYESGTLGEARDIKTELEAFDVYVTDKMLEIILTHTNDEIKIAEYYTKPNPVYVYPLSIIELKAFIGILLFSALKRDNKQSSTFLWGESGSDIYNAAMPQERFDYICQCLRFDEFSTRNIKAKKDSFSQVREIWDYFIAKCSQVFRPSRNCTIDEIYINFNGNCRFKLPLPKEPQKYGIQLILLSDSNDRYIISGIPYLDKNNNDQIPLTEYMVEKLTKPIRGTNINITYASEMFTSVALSKKMMKLHKLSTIGGLHKNHNEIPPDVTLTENRPIGSLISIYNAEDEQQLCSYCPWMGEIMTLLSSKYFQVTPNTEGMPKMIEYYNSTKGGVAAVNRMCHNYSCSRPTKNWFVAVFYTILDLAAINSFTILNSNRARVGKTNVRRKDFLYKLALDLMLPHMKDRLTELHISDSIKKKIQSIEEERLKLNVGLNPPKYTFNQIMTMYPPTEPEACSSSKKLSVQQIQDLYPPIYNSRQIKSDLPDLKPGKLVKLSIAQVQEKYPPFYYGAPVEQAGLDIRTLAPGIQRMSNMYLPTYNNISIMTNFLSLNVNWNQIRALYSPSQSTGPIFSVVPNLLTAQQGQRYFPSMLSNLNIPLIRPFQNIGWSYMDILRQQIQVYCAFMSMQTVRAQNLTMEMNNRSISFGATVSSTTTQNMVEVKRELYACGVCKCIGDKNCYGQCSKCAVVVCAVHRKILCTTCFNKLPATPKLFAAFFDKAQCGFCPPDRLISYSEQCYKCAQFLCSEHRQMLCCFCVSV